MLGIDEVVADLACLSDAKTGDFIEAGGTRKAARRRQGAVTADLVDLGSDGFERNPERLERLSRDAFAFADQAQKVVLSSDVIVVEEAGFFGRQHHYAAGSGRERNHGGNVPPSLRAQAINSLEAWREASLGAEDVTGHRIWTRCSVPGDFRPVKIEVRKESRAGYLRFDKWHRSDFRIEGPRVRSMRAAVSQIASHKRAGAE
jgi:hypothetical protein